MKNINLPKDVKNAYLKKLRTLWPAVKGSLVEVRKPCIRKNCPKCASGEKHRAFIYSFTKDGKQKCRYVSRELAQELRKAVDNGKAIEKMMIELGENIIQNYRESRSKQK